MSARAPYRNAKVAGMSAVYDTEVIVKSVSVADMVARYCKPEVFIESCKACPDYGRVWSCPPGVPSAAEFLAGYRTACLAGIKVKYSKKTIEMSQNLSDKELDDFRRSTYGKVKSAMNDSFLEIEKAIPGSVSVAAGRCERCPKCARLEGKPCRFPDKMRYSFSALGFDINAMSDELLRTKLLWSNKGLPKYLMAIAVIFIR